jgi:hypothetical protein
MSLDEGTVFLRFFSDEREHFIEACCVVPGESEALDIFCEEPVIKSDQLLFLIPLSVDKHLAVFRDFQKGETLGELDNHVFQVTALNELGPIRDAGACFEDAPAGAGHVKIRNAADACGQEVKVELRAMGH